MHSFVALSSVFTALLILYCKGSEARPELIFESNGCEYEGMRLMSGVSITLNHTCVKVSCERGRVRREECPHIEVANDPYCGAVNGTGPEFPECCPLYYCEESWDFDLSPTKGDKGRWIKLLQGNQQCFVSEINDELFRSTMRSTMARSDYLGIWNIMGEGIHFLWSRDFN